MHGFSSGSPDSGQRESTGARVPGLMDRAN
jgi:hypothetical protein